MSKDWNVTNDPAMGELSRNSDAIFADIFEVCALRRLSFVCERQPLYSYLLTTTLGRTNIRQWTETCFSRWAIPRKSLGSDVLPRRNSEVNGERLFSG